MGRWNGGFERRGGSIDFGGQSRSCSWVRAGRKNGKNEQTRAIKDWNVVRPVRENGNWCVGPREGHGPKKDGRTVEKEAGKRDKTGGEGGDVQRARERERGQRVGGVARGVRSDTSARRGNWLRGVDATNRRGAGWVDAKKIAGMRRHVLSASRIEDTIIGGE